MASHMSPASEDAQKKSGSRLLWIIPVSIVAVLAVVYFGGVAAFNLYFMPGTTLDGTDVSMRALSDVASQKTASLADFETHVTGNGIDLTVKGSDIDLAYDGTSYANDALSQINVWAWPYEVTQTRELTAEATSSFDATKLAGIIDPAVEQVKANAGEAGDAAISYDADEGRFTLDQATIPQHLDAAAVTEAVGAAIEAGQTEVQIGDDCLDVGDSLTKALDKANSYVAATLKLSLGGTDAYELTADKIASWVKLDDDLNATLDADAIADWCHGELSEALDSVGTKRSYTRPDGKECTVYDDRSNYNNDPYGSSVYGWSIDGEKAAEDIAAALEAGKATTLELPTLSEAEKFNPGGQDWGDRYIDVDITEQHARFYDGGELIWEADITTGQPSKHHDTPTGVWVIGANGGVKQEGDVNLRGPVDASGNPEWDSHVNFWIPVVRNLVGFHNCPWQGEFGGDIYTYYGSNGCIRMSYESADALYDLAQMGDTVVIHH